MIVEAIEMLRGAEPRQCRQIFALIEIKQHIAPMQIFDDLRRTDQR
jgi:hypothetical protein